MYSILSSPFNKPISIELFHKSNKCNRPLTFWPFVAHIMPYFGNYHGVTIVILLNLPSSLLCLKGHFSQHTNTHTLTQNGCYNCFPNVLQSITNNFFVGELLISTREILIVAPIFERLTGLRRTKWNSIESNWGLESDRNLHFSRSFFSSFLLGPAIGVTFEIGGRKLVDFHRKLLLIFENVGEKPSPMGPTEMNFFPLFVEIQRIASNKFVFSEQTRFFPNKFVFSSPLFLDYENGRFFLVKKISTLFSCLRNSPPSPWLRKCPPFFLGVENVHSLCFISSHRVLELDISNRNATIRCNGQNCTQRAASANWSAALAKSTDQVSRIQIQSAKIERARAHLRFTARKFHTC